MHRPLGATKPSRRFAKGKLWLLIGLLTSGSLVVPSTRAQQPVNQQEPTAGSLEADLDRMVRRLYLASAEDQRVETLVSLLSDGSAVVVRSALDLALREQAGGSRLDERIIEAVLGLLSHADAGIRSRAAALADLIATPQAGNAILAQLRDEPDPAVAEVLLRAGARWPDQLDPQAVLRWVRPDAPISTGQARALAELKRSGRLTDDAANRDVLASLALVPDLALTQPMCRLLASLGGSREHARLSALLSSGDTTIRRRAATALAEVPQLSGIVIRAAMSDPHLVEAAASATKDMPPREALTTLLMLPEATPDAASKPIRAIADRLPIATLVSMADARWSPSRGVDLLWSVRTRRVENALRGQALVMLAEALAERGDTEQAADAAALAGTMLGDSEPWRERAALLAAVDTDPEPGGP